MLEGQEFDVDHGLMFITSQSRAFGVRDRLQVEHLRTIEDEDRFVITDFVRTGPLLRLISVTEVEANSSDQ